MTGNQAEPSSGRRTSGVLCHPTSLPGPGQVGSFGGDADRFVSLLASLGQRWWQMLPVGPTGYADSPYQSSSTFAGNPILIDATDLMKVGLVAQAPAPSSSGAPSGGSSDGGTHRVDYRAAFAAQRSILSEAADRFESHASSLLRQQREEFIERHSEVWLGDFGLFTAIKRANDLRPWWDWDVALAKRDPTELVGVSRQLKDQIEAVITEQFLFDCQFDRLHRHARDKGVGLIGDIPIFVAHDSADVWANPELFHLDSHGAPTVVAGVPPDYFSKTGQRWGNPLYNWDRHRDEGFRWWTARLGRLFDQFELVRIDHFRGFAASWHIPASQLTAQQGEWVEAPGQELFDHLTAVFGELPVIAEDLGVITPDVEALRDRYGFPGMKVLQFGFGTESVHAIDQFRENVVAYTGTHDNDTAIGWWNDRRRDRRAERRVAEAALGTDGSAFHWDLIEAVSDSVASTVIIPLQDVLGLGTEARMNFPGTTDGNWQWRFTWDQLTHETTRRLAEITHRTGRSPSGLTSTT